MKMSFTKFKKRLIYESKKIRILPQRFSLSSPNVNLNKEGKYSRDAMSDCTDLKAPAVMTSIREVVDYLIENGVKKMHVVSGSP